MKNILFVFGGTSSEYTVSLQSAYSVIKTVDRSEYNPITVGITRDGGWYLYEGEMDKIPQDLWYDKEHCVPVILSPSEGALLIMGEKIVKQKIDAVFPVLHGKGGEDGTVQGLCELAKIPCIGCGIMSSAIGMNKMAAHIMAEHANINVPQAFLWEENLKVEDMKYPVFVKPLDGGSSLGISKVSNEKEMLNAISEAKRYSPHIIVEENIVGKEVGVAVLEKKGELIIGEIDEIELEQGFFDFIEKYNLKTSKILVPARIKDGIRNQIKEYAKRIFKILGCSGFARIDFFVTEEDQIYFNEINTIPGFTSHSRFPNMLKKVGYTFEEIINTIIEEAVNE